MQHESRTTIIDQLPKDLVADFCKMANPTMWMHMEKYLLSDEYQNEDTGMIMNKNGPSSEVRLFGSFVITIGMEQYFENQFHFWMHPGSFTAGLNLLTNRLIHHDNSVWYKTEKFVKLDQIKEELKRYELTDNFELIPNFVIKDGCVIVTPDYDPKRYQLSRFSPLSLRNFKGGVLRWFNTIVQHLEKQTAQ